MTLKIITPSIERLWSTPQAEQIIEQAARTCYKSEGKITSDSAAPLIRKLVHRDHHAMLEHASASFKWVCDRGVTHELVRHRLASFAQESTRFCQYDNGITVILPPGLSDGYHDWKIAVLHAERQYVALIGRGSPPQIARSVLPICVKTEIVVTANLREWRHIMELRTATAAHPQIRQLAEWTLYELKGIAPTVFEDFESQSRP